MLKESFLGRNPSHFVINPIVKAYIVSESFLWSGWYLAIPLLSIFVVKYIPGSTIEQAGFSFSVYFVSRVIFELISGRYLKGSTDKQKFSITIVGMICTSLAYLGMAFSANIMHVYFSFAIAGVGLGLATPAKNSLFSVHLDKNKESTEWSLADGAQFTCIALATALGGFIANTFGFQVLFLIAAIINLIATIPYLLYVF
ncbi:MAG: MFS transporter [Candidatus Levybacteria bacterium]|nr:MFS transporter [Candidatus Levybacteria bacterium]